MVKSAPGIISLLLLRDCMHHCRSADEVVERMANTQRGVTWLYPVVGYDRGRQQRLLHRGRDVLGWATSARGCR